MSRTYLRPLVEVLVFLLGILVLSGYSGALGKLFRTRVFSSAMKASPPDFVE